LPGAGRALSLQRSGTSAAHVLRVRGSRGDDEPLRALFSYLDAMNAHAPRL
jgi:hypothetical protein